MNNITLESLGANSPPPDMTDTPFPEVETGVAEVTAEELDTPSSHYSPGVTTGLEEKALNLLGSGIPAESVASALGVTPGRIAQLLSVDSFSEQVSRLRYKSLQSHNVRDGKYDSLEDILLDRLKKSLPLMIKPRDILDAVKTVNAAKRRGQSAPAQVINTQNIINLTLPKVIAEKFAVNISNQVVKAGEQELLTMPSGNLLKQVEDATTAKHQQAQQVIEQRVQDLLEDNSNVQEEGG